MDKNTKGVLAVVIAFAITIVVWNLGGFDQHHLESDTILVPTLFGGGALGLFLLLWFFWVQK